MTLFWEMSERKYEEREKESVSMHIRHQCQPTHVQVVAKVLLQQFVVLDITKSTVSTKNN